MFRSGARRGQTQLDDDHDCRHYCDELTEIMLATTSAHRCGPALEAGRLQALVPNFRPCAWNKIRSTSTRMC
jgi:hypothetical protein